MICSSHPDPEPCEGKDDGNRPFVKSPVIIDSSTNPVILSEAKDLRLPDTGTAPSRPTPADTRFPPIPS
ncbi:MAG TPA: hypothetical protein VGD64_05915 [Acidisarcina sp.]